MRRSKPHSYQLYALVGRFAQAVRFQPATPVFMVGTGRCGSSLLTEILKTHRDIIGYPGEANELWRSKVYPFRGTKLQAPRLHEDPRTFTEISVAHWPNGHEQFVKQALAGFHYLNGRHKLFFVKSAMISFMVSKILAMWPTARFIHIYRNGPSVIESMYTRSVTKNREHNLPPPDRVYQLNCARYWNDCILELDRANKALDLTQNNRFFECSYEALCNDPRGVLNEIAAFLNVDPAGFAFDLSQIKSTNYKVGAYDTRPEWAELLELMRPAMTLKGYIRQ
jgi:hypothetical protein